MKVGRLFLLTILLLTVFASSMTVFASRAGRYNADDALAYHRIVFLIDISGSMNTEDPYGIRNEISKMLVDSFHSSRTQMGFVAFNNTITHSHPLTSMASQAARDNIKTEMDQLETRGWTDIGIGLNYAVNMLVNAPQAQNISHTRSAIIFLSDGERTNNPADGRTMEDASADHQEAIEMAARYGILIHSISISAVGQFDLTSMYDISNATDGNWYEINLMSQLPDLFEELFADLTGITPVRHSITGTGSQQSLEIHIPHYHAIESSIMVWHNGALQSDVDGIYASFAPPTPSDRKSVV